HKNDAKFPHKAIAYCLREAGLKTAENVDIVGFYDSSFLKLERLLQTALNEAPSAFEPFQRSIPQWVTSKAWVTDTLRESLAWKKEIRWCSHHESHAASAFFPSPFESATIVTLDGVGEWATSAWGHGRGNQIEMREEVRFPHSLGLLYSAFTHFLGFKVNS